MAEVKIENALTVKTLRDTFEHTIKTLDYTEDITVTLCEGCELDLAGIQILLSMKKTAEQNGKNVRFQGVPSSFSIYLESGDEAEQA